LIAVAITGSCCAGLIGDIISSQAALLTPHDMVHNFFGDGLFGSSHALLLISVQ